MPTAAPPQTIATVTLSADEQAELARIWQLIDESQARTHAHFATIDRLRDETRQIKEESDRINEEIETILKRLEGKN